MHYDAILEKLREVDPPTSLRKVQKLVIAAIQEQRAFLNQWQKSGHQEFLQSNRRVQSSKLRSAYCSK